jgi:bacteriocin biosynthesis cyclodehydratase domain-containing protein
MLNRPRFKPHYRVQVVPGEGVFVLSEARQALLRGRLYEQVVPCLDGRSSDDVCAQLHEQVSPAEVYFVLGQLEKKGYLCEEDPSLPAAEAALWSALQVDPATAARRLAQTPVALFAFGVDAAPLRELLRAMRVRLDNNAALGVVLTDNYLREELEAFNAEALRRERTWLLVRPFGRQIWIGPLFRAGVTGCWNCLAQRLRANQPVLTYVSARTGQDGTAETPPCTPATLHLAWGLTAQAVAAGIARGDWPTLEGQVQSFDVLTWQTQAHVLVRLPYCSACGQGNAPVNGHPHELVLTSQSKTFTQDGGHRVVSPEATLQRYGRHVSPITGAVSMLERVGITGDGAMHVYLAGTNLARRHRNLDHLRGDLRNMSSGKGVSDVQARASGLCEELERYSGVYRGDEPRRRALPRSRRRCLASQRLHVVQRTSIPRARRLERAQFHLQPRSPALRSTSGDRMDAGMVAEAPPAALSTNGILLL